MNNPFTFLKNCGRQLGQLGQLLMPAPAAIVDYPFVISDVARYSRLHADTGSAMLDPQTWDELLLTQYCAGLGGATSIFGQQMLYHSLYAGRDGAANAARLRTLIASPERQAAMQHCIKDLRRCDREVSDTLYGAPLAPPPRWHRFLGSVPLAFLLTGALALVSGSLTLWLLLLLLWLLLMGLQARYYEATSEWRRVLFSLQQMLRAHSLLGALDDPLLAPCREGAVAAGKLARRLARSPVEQLPGVQEYSDWLWLKNIRHYFASRLLVQREAAFLRDSFGLIAQIEADLALARHLQQAPHYCWSETGGTLSFEQLIHPLLEQARPLSLALAGQGAFISGQNGIGKSTLLRSVGLNLVVARTFGFCYARAACVPVLAVYSSMRGEDALGSGESLYIAELRRARELLALAGADQPALSLIDEIFRGTNHLESVAAAAVLDTLARTSLVLVSSHNLVLVPLLAGSLTPLRIVHAGADPASLQLDPGVLVETNGLSLLSQRGFDAQIDAKARRVAHWLGAYLAHPGDCAGVLGER